jgi:TolB-like protein/tetratricopeptide (TPR) repeat protein
VSPETVPQLGDRFFVEGRLGTGGMGQVYLAQDRKHNRRVAIKVLDRTLADVVGPERFIHEVSTLATLVHPNVVPLYDSGEFEGSLYYVMPYIEGQSLRQRLQREMQLPLQTALQWTIELADALAYAHGRGVIHRDIKPANIMIQANHALLTDFGIARAIDVAAGEQITNTGIAVGTPTYMSPEQASGQSRLDGRTDMYSLACVLYEMLAGEPPFRGATLQATTAKKLVGHYSRLSSVRPLIPRSVDRCLARALAPVAAERYETMDEFAKALVAVSRPAVRRLVITTAAIAVIGAGTWVVVKALSGSAAHRGVPRVAVGVFDNRTGDRRDEYVGIMAADWITQGLQRAGVIEVVPTTTALAASQYLRQQGSSDPVRGLAQETGATLVITGSIYRAGDSLVIQTQLTDPATGTLVGVPEPIRTQAANPAEGLSRLRARLMGLLALQLDERLGSFAAESDQPPTFAAYQAFSEGMDAYVRTEFKSALASFLHAHELDSTFVTPLVYAANCYTNVKNYPAADSVWALLSRRTGALSQYDRYWVEYSRAELRGAHIAALAAIRKAALLAPESKATYNFAVQAYEARQPFAAESALLQLSPDRGPMRGWLPYWEVLTDALHIQGKHESELTAAHTARLRFPEDPASYALEVRALAALHRTRDITAMLDETERTSAFTPLQLGEVAFEAISELRAHGDSVSAIPFLTQADRWFARDSGQHPLEAMWGRVQIAAYRGSWSEATVLGKVLVKADPSSVKYRGMLGVALAKSGDQVAARRILAYLAEDRQPYTLGIPQYEAARVAAALGQKEEAVRLILLAHSKGYPLYYEYPLSNDPHRDIVLGDLRQDPLLRPVVGR